MATNVRVTGNNLRTQLPKAEDVSDQIRSPISAAAGGVKEVGEPSAKVKKLSKRWKMTRALMEGTDAMREADREFLPQEPAESTRAYENRLDRSVLFGAFKKTVTTSTGRPFSRPITFEKFSPTLEAMNDNIDLQGNNIHVFARHSFMSGLAHGHSFILIDHPKRPDLNGESNEPPSLEMERAMNLRPYWRKIDAFDVIGWRSAVVGGVEIPLQVRIKESTTKPVGQFGEKVVERIRVLEPGGFRLYERRDSGEWELEDQGQFIKSNGEVMNKIPIVPFYSTLPKSFYCTTPTLLDLAFMNVLHWQSSSDQENILHVARVPILFASGFFDDDDIEIGSSRWVKGPEGSTLAFVEHSGTAIQAGRDSLEDLENRMRVMGAEILVRDPNRVTATQKVLDSDEATSELQDMVTRYEDFLAQCYALTAEWLGEDPESAVGEIDIFKDFGVSVNAFQEAQNLLQIRLAKQITQDTFLTEMKRRGLLGDDVDVEIEVALTEAEAQEARDFMNQQMNRGGNDDDFDEE